MNLQRSLAGLPGVQDAGVIMGTDSNKELLKHINLVSDEVNASKPDDLVIVVRAEDEKSAVDAISQVDDLLSRRKSGIDQEYQPHSLETAVEMLPDASWVLISVAGRYAAGVARDALRLNRHVFLFSDNVSVEDEITLKQRACEQGLLVMGPDCGTAMIGGMGLGFANKVRKGPIGVVAAAGTGLQQVTSRIHQLGSGITHGIGTGGRDMSEKVGAVTFRLAIDVLSPRSGNQSHRAGFETAGAASCRGSAQGCSKDGQTGRGQFVARAVTAQPMDNLLFRQQPGFTRRRWRSNWPNRVRQ